MRPALITIAEPELIVAKSIEHIIAARGHRVVGIVTTGDDLISGAAEMQPDLVLVDTCLKGGLNGFDTARTVLKRWRIPSVFLTTDPGDITRGRSYLIGTSECLVKPFSEKSLFSSIDRVLARSR